MKNDFFHNTNYVCVASIVTASCLHKHCFMCKEQRRKEVVHETILYSGIRDGRASRQALRPDCRQCLDDCLKAQVTVEYEDGEPVRLSSVVVSCQHREDKLQRELEHEIREKVLKPALRILPPDEEKGTAGS